MSRSEVGVNKFREGYNCAQSLIFSYSDKVNISKDLALRLANGFGGGMGRKQEVCGAVSGGILVLSLLYGRGESEDKEKQEEAYSKVRELIDKFEDKYGTINCKKLLDGCSLLTPEGQEVFKSKQMIKRCYGYVDYTVKTLEEIIE
ncbi:C-GCAxxG-C-C family protein [Halonatronum saccharophilum]|uniref:C-GCAxxG-C-C family protein n=1 Tax=Halonatronum saccharophilum TaxID=150060 RepID=UPI0004801113|nr:C-GCAxxG-C-C family protein [Halonatronum saccharophilum]